ncbi:MAG TPA: hypothetical protein VFC15_17995 [Candidatus Limnocylindrales bacterium]|nr:hypothetical protein [Candidatus Limnocylindrales bacterium]HZM12106.1 hypothetical protein [Candidatus Limnocylindrales bacterium]
MEGSTEVRSARLKELAQGMKLGTLTDAESLLLEKVPTGSCAICGPSGDDKDKRNDASGGGEWERSRQICSQFLVWLCTSEEARKQIGWRGIQIYGAEITSLFDLSFASVPFPLVFRRCRFKQGINLRRADLAELDLSGSLVHKFHADRLTVKNCLYLRSATIVGEASLLGSQIGGDLDGEGSALNNPGGMALMADGINVKGSIYLRNGFAAHGTVQLQNAQIGAVLDCDGATFSDASTSLDADEINVKGSVFFRSLTAGGEVRLVRAQIGNNIECDGATIDSKNGRALNANAVSVSGSIFLRSRKNENEITPFKATGEVNLNTAHVEGQIDCSGGIVIKSGAEAFEARGVVVKGSVFLCDKFEAEGKVHLQGAQIGGAFDCKGGNFVKATFDLTDASAGTLIDSGLNFRPSGPSDESLTVWPVHGALFLDGFSYNRISSEGRIDVHQRIGWLGRQAGTPFRLQPYLQLAKILRDSGDAKGSLRVLETMEELRRRDEQNTPRTGSCKGLRKLADKVWSLLLKWTIGYGYYPQRAIGALLILFALGWACYFVGYYWSKMVPAESSAYKEYASKGTLPAYYPRFSAGIYSLENSLPLVKLGQADKWQPDPTSQSPRILIWFLRIQILLGWMLATFFVAGVTGVVHKQ